MKIYRYVCEDEYNEIKDKNVFRMWDSRKWGKNEGVIQRILEKTDEKENRKIIELVEAVKKNNKSLQNADILDTTRGYSSLQDKLLCDIFTEVLHYYQLCITSFCQCWTTNDKGINIGLDDYHKYVARIEAETFDQCSKKLDINDERKDWIFRFGKVNYNNYSYSKNIENIIDDFNKNERKFSFFVKTLQNKHYDQNEIRLIATLEDQNIRGSILAFPRSKFYKENSDINDLSNALHETALDILENNNRFCLLENGNRYIYYSIPEGFIKDIQEL